MKVMELVNEFKDNNIGEILSALNDMLGKGFGYYNRFGAPILPFLSFTSEQEIEYGTYSFRIGNATFHNARVFKYATDADGKDLYRCGSYNVIVE